MLVYKYPGTMIEYLEGKAYDFKTIEESEIDTARTDGWGATPDEAEILSTLTVKPDA